MKKSHTFLTRVVRIMRDMKNSGIEWIGEIPKDWQTITNKYNFDLNKEIIGSRWNTTQLLSLTKNGIKKIEQGEQTGKVPSSFSTYQKVNRNNIVMCLFDLDCSAVFSGISKFNGMISPAYKCFKCKKHLYPLYVDYYFRAVFVDRKYKRYSKNIRYSLTSDEFFSLPILVPKLEEQKQIADFLDRKCSEIDALRLEIEKEIATLKEYKKSIITEAVTKGLNKNVPMKDSGIEWIDKIPKEWEIIRVKDKYYFNTGFTPDTKNPEYYNDEDGYEWVTISDINNGKINSPTISLISRDYVKNNFCKQVPKGYLLYSFKLSIGQTAITDRPLFTNEALASFIPSPNTNIRFLNYSSSLIEFNANTNIYGAKILNQQLINNAYIVFPPLNEQKQIADYLDRKCSKINDIIKAKNKQLSTLDEYKKSLIYEYVTGKKEVPSV